MKASAKGAEKLVCVCGWHQSEWFIWGLPSPLGLYTNVAHKVLAEAASEG